MRAALRVMGPITSGSDAAGVRGITKITSPQCFGNCISALRVIAELSFALMLARTCPFACLPSNRNELTGLNRYPLRSQEDW
jgi:hypothetical protein